MWQKAWYAHLYSSLSSFSPPQIISNNSPFIISYLPKWKFSALKPVARFITVSRVSTLMEPKCIRWGICCSFLPISATVYPFLIVNVSNFPYLMEQYESGQLRWESCDVPFDYTPAHTHTPLRTSLQGATEQATKPLFKWHANNTNTFPQKLLKSHFCSSTCMHNIKHCSNASLRQFLVPAKVKNCMQQRTQTVDLKTRYYHCVF